MYTHTNTYIHKHHHFSLKPDRPRQKRLYITISVVINTIATAIIIINIVVFNS